MTVNFGETFVNKNACFGMVKQFPIH